MGYQRVLAQSGSSRRARVWKFTVVEIVGAIAPHQSIIFSSLFFLNTYHSVYNTCSIQGSLIT